MTASPTLIGIGAGLVAAALFVSLSNGSFIGLMLFCLVPLPVFLAGIGWGLRATLICIVTAVLLLALLLSPLSAISFSVMVGVPALILSYLMSLHREVPADGGGEMGEAPSAPLLEWYPIGRIVSWSAVIVGGLVSTGLILFDAGSDSYYKAIKTFFEEAAGPQLEAALGPEQGQVALQRTVDLFARFLLPLITGASCLFIFVGNLWLAARSAAISGLLTRPAPRFSEMDYPPFVIGGFVLAVLVSLMPGLTGMVGLAFLGAFAGAFLLLGLSVLHLLLSNSQFKPLILVALYTGLLLATLYVAPPIIVLGLAEPFVQLRQRHRARMTPPGGPGPNF